MAAFALTPALAIDGIIDMTTTEGAKIYREGSKGIESEDLIACSPRDLYRALKLIEMRAEEYGWSTPESGILWIPRDPQDPDSECDLITRSHGMITTETITEFESTYLGSETREAQDNHMLYQAIMKGLSKEAKNKIMLKRDEYTIDGQPSANLLIKILVRECHLDTNATVATIRNNLAKLDEYIVTVGYDIGKLNDYVQTNVQELETRGEESHDIVLNLFRGYANAKDSRFRAYIQTKKDAYDEATGEPPFTYNQLMVLAENKYKTMRINGEWNAPTEHDKELVALKAEVRRLERGRSKAKSDKGDEKGSNDEEKKKKKKRKSMKPDWLFKNERPNDVNETRTWKDNKYYFCCTETGGKCNGMWRVHVPTECKGKGYLRNEDEENKKKKLKLSKAYNAIVDEEDEGEETDMDIE